MPGLYRSYVSLDQHARASERVPAPALRGRVQSPDRQTRGRERDRVPQPTRKDLDYVFSIQTWDESGGAPHSLNPGTAGGLKASRCALGNTSLLSRLRWFTFAARRPTLDSVKVCDWRSFVKLA